MPTGPTFRLYIFGSAASGPTAQTLLLFAEFQKSRAVERVSIVQEKFQALSKTIRELRAFINSGYPPFEEGLLQELGSSLFDLVITEDVRVLFNQAVGAAAGRFLPLEIFVEDYEIAGWPWEYLFDTATNEYLCQAFHPISRGIFSINCRSVEPKADTKIRILVLIGVLPEDPSTTAKDEIAWIQEVFESELAQELVEIHVKQAVSPRELNSELQRSAYDILHFFGHAGYDERKRQGYLRFDQRAGEPFRFYAKEFSRLVAGRGIRMAFLNACETGVSGDDSDPGRSSIAASLLNQGIPAVVATQFTMPDASSHLFSSGIYNALACGRPLGEALRDSRGAMSFDGKSQFFDWGIPVLYASDPDLILFNRTKRPEDPVNMPPNKRSDPIIINATIPRL